MIEINLNLLKDERGTHEGYVLVHRQGKIFQRRQKLGRKEQEKILKQKNLIEVIDWLNDHIRSQNGIYPSKNVIKTIKKYGWTYNGKVYRGIQGNFNLNRIKIEKPFSSWTKSKNVAISFALTGGYDDWLINDNNLKFPNIKDRIKKRFGTKQINNITY